MLYLALIAILVIIGNFVGIYLKNITDRKDYLMMLRNHRENFHKNHKDKK